MKKTSVQLIPKNYLQSNIPTKYQYLPLLLIFFTMSLSIGLFCQHASATEVYMNYGVEGSGWWAGVSITNLSQTNATESVSAAFYAQNGTWLGNATIGILNPFENHTRLAENLFGGPLPTIFSMRVWHEGDEPLAITQYTGKTGSEDFSFQTIYSEDQDKHRNWSKIIESKSRFQLVMMNNAVLDKETGLVWQRTTENDEKDWEEACNYCYTLEVANRKGWRIPTIEELASLVDNDNESPALPTNHPFTNFQSSYYWSGSTHAGFPDYAWYVHFYDGYVSGNGKDRGYYVRCVRGGHGYDTR